MTGTAPDDIIRESATVVLLREAEPEFEVLLLKKNPSLNYGGSWVFPGGVVEPQDSQQAVSEFQSDRRSAVALATVIRETQEETGLELSPTQLTPFSNWLTPKLKIKRYNTLFFAAALNPDQRQHAIKIDGEEIIDFKWVSATEALRQQADDRMALNGPSFVTLSQLSRYRSAEQAMEALSAADVCFYEPRGTRISKGVATVYHGDALYRLDQFTEVDMAATTGPKHRLYMYQHRPWAYEDTRDSH